MHGTGQGSWAVQRYANRRLQASSMLPSTEGFPLAQVVWNAYISAMREAAFSDTMGLYVASALLTYGDSDGGAPLLPSVACGSMQHFVTPVSLRLLNAAGLTLVLDKLTNAGLCSGIHYKELYLPEGVLQGEEAEAPPGVALNPCFTWNKHEHAFLPCAELNSEQSALLDFLILYRGRSFVGFGLSTFSYYLREYRALLGIPKSTSVLVNSTEITTDNIFNAAGTVTLPEGEEEWSLY